MQYLYFYLLLLILTFIIRGFPESQKSLNFPINSRKISLFYWTFSGHGKPSSLQLRTPLIFAAKCGHLDLVKCLLENGADINKADKKVGNLNDIVNIF